MMSCPECGAKSKVIDTRTLDDYVWRRKQCSEDHRFTTREYLWPSGHLDEDTELFVVQVLEDARTRGDSESEGEHARAISDLDQVRARREQFAQELDEWVRAGKMEDRHLPQREAKGAPRTR